MKPNGGKSHFTPITHLCRDFTYDGSAGSFGFAEAAAAPSLPAVVATLVATNTSDAATASTSVRPARRFIPLLLPRLARAPPGSRPAAVCGAGSAAFVLPSDD